MSAKSFFFYFLCSTALLVAGLFFGNKHLDHQAYEAVSVQVERFNKVHPEIYIHAEEVKANPLEGSVTLSNVTIKHYGSPDSPSITIAQLTVNTTPEKEGVSFLQYNAKEISLTKAPSTKISSKKRQVYTHLSAGSDTIRFNSQGEIILDPTTQNVQLSVSLLMKRLGAITIDARLSGVYKEINSAVNTLSFSPLARLDVLLATSLDRSFVQLQTDGFRTFILTALPPGQDKNILRKIDEEIKKNKTVGNNEDVLKTLRSFKRAFREDKELLLTLSTLKPINLPTLSEAGRALLNTKNASDANVYLSRFFGLRSTIEIARKKE
jgi:hypothetical protein